MSKSVVKTTNLLVSFCASSKQPTKKSRSRQLDMMKQHGKANDLTREDWLRALRAAKGRVAERTPQLEALIQG